MGTHGFEAVLACASNIAISLAKKHCLVLAIAGMRPCYRKKGCSRDSYSAFAYVFASMRGFAATLACVSGIFNTVAEVFDFGLAIARAWSWHCIHKQIHAGDIAAACTDVPSRLLTFIPTKMQPKKMKLLAYSMYNRMIKFCTKLRSLVREYEDIVTAHDECGCSLCKFHEQLLLKIPIFTLHEGV